VTERTMTGQPAKPDRPASGYKKGERLMPSNILRRPVKLPAMKPIREEGKGKSP